MSKRVTVIVEGREYIVEVGDLDESPIKATVNQRTYHVEVPRQDAQTTQPEPPPLAAPVTEDVGSSPTLATNSAITAPMPGNILEVRVKVGDGVEPGDVVCVLEAMKMKNMIRANRTGVIASVDVSAGQAVDYGAVLATFQ